MRPDEDTLPQRCAAVVERLYARYRWSLAHREDITRETLLAHARHPKADLAYLAFGAYNHVLYRACCGIEGEDQWQRGYSELSTMLFDRARQAYPAVWEDAVQTALERVSAQIGTCSVPQAFFEFAWGYVQNAARSHLRQNAKQQPLGQHTATAGDPVIDQVLSAEQRAEFLACLAQCVRDHPRAQQQFAAIQLKFLDGLDDEAISRCLATSVKRVHELRSLGLKKLRAHPCFRHLTQPDTFRR